jgi:hypothetical protein
MTASPKVPNMTLDPYPRERCVEVDGKRSTGRKELRHPSSSNTRGGGRPNIWKKSDEETDTCDDEIDLTDSGRPTCKVRELTAEWSTQVETFP